MSLYTSFPVSTYADMFIEQQRDGTYLAHAKAVWTVSDRDKKLYGGYVPFMALVKV